MAKAGRTTETAVDPVDVPETERALVVVYYGWRKRKNCNDLVFAANAIGSRLGVTFSATDVGLANGGGGNPRLTGALKLAESTEPIEIFNAYTSHKLYRKLGYSSASFAAMCIPTTEPRIGENFVALSVSMQHAVAASITLDDLIEQSINLFDGFTGFAGNIPASTRLQQFASCLPGSGDDYAFNRAMELYFETITDLVENFAQIREVNFMTKGHINRKIFGVPMLEWISVSNWGETQKLQEGLWRWDVPHLRLDEVRIQAEKLGLMAMNKQHLR